MSALVETSSPSVKTEGKPEGRHPGSRSPTHFQFPIYPEARRARRVRARFDRDFSFEVARGVTAVGTSHPESRVAQHGVLADTRRCSVSVEISRRLAAQRPHPLVGEIAGVNAKVEKCMAQSVIQCDPEILSGIPVFAGTRVPAKNLVDYLEGGHSLDEFLEDFPSVTREQAIAALEEAKGLLLAHASSSR